MVGGRKQQNGGIASDFNRDGTPDTLELERELYYEEIQKRGPRPERKGPHKGPGLEQLDKSHAQLLVAYHKAQGRYLSAALQESLYLFYAFMDDPDLKPVTKPIKGFKDVTLGIGHDLLNDFDPISLWIGKLLVGAILQNDPTKIHNPEPTSVVFAKYALNEAKSTTRKLSKEHKSAFEDNIHSYALQFGGYSGIKDDIVIPAKDAKGLIAGKHKNLSDVYHKVRAAELGDMLGNYISHVGVKKDGTLKKQINGETINITNRADVGKIINHIFKGVYEVKLPKSSAEQIEEHKKALKKLGVDVDEQKDHDKKPPHQGGGGVVPIGPNDPKVPGGTRPSNSVSVIDSRTGKPSASPDEARINKISNTLQNRPDAEIAALISLPEGLRIVETAGRKVILDEEDRPTALTQYIKGMSASNHSELEAKLGIKSTDKDNEAPEASVLGKKPSEVEKASQKEMSAGVLEELLKKLELDESTLASLLKEDVRIAEAGYIYVSVDGKETTLRKYLNALPPESLAPVFQGIETSFGDRLGSPDFSNSLARSITEQAEGSIATELEKKRKSVRAILEQLGMTDEDLIAMLGLFTFVHNAKEDLEIKGGDGTPPVIFSRDASGNFVLDNEVTLDALSATEINLLRMARRSIVTQAGESLTDQQEALLQGEVPELKHLITLINQLGLKTYPISEDIRALIKDHEKDIADRNLPNFELEPSATAASSPSIADSKKPTSIPARSIVIDEQPNLAPVAEKDLAELRAEKQEIIGRILDALNMTDQDLINMLNLFIAKNPDKENLSIGKNEEGRPVLLINGQSDEDGTLEAMKSMLLDPLARLRENNHIFENNMVDNPSDSRFAAMIEFMEITVDEAARIRSAITGVKEVPPVDVAASVVVASDDGSSSNTEEIAPALSQASKGFFTTLASGFANFLKKVTGGAGAEAVKEKDGDDGSSSTEQAIDRPDASDTSVKGVQVKERARVREATAEIAERLVVLDEISDTEKRVAATQEADEDRREEAGAGLSQAGVGNSDASAKPEMAEQKASTFGAVVKAAKRALRRAFGKKSDDSSGAQSGVALARKPDDSGDGSSANGAERGPPSNAKESGTEVRSEVGQIKIREEIKDIIKSVILADIIADKTTFLERLKSIVSTGKRNPKSDNFLSAVDALGKEVSPPKDSNALLNAAKRKDEGDSEAAEGKIPQPVMEAASKVAELAAQILTATNKGADEVRVMLQRLDAMNDNIAIMESQMLAARLAKEAGGRMNGIRAELTVEGHPLKPSIPDPRAKNPTAIDPKDASRRPPDGHQHGIG